jgi:pSer/pThr/pTyr-binding forkhead associated (FHA) protein
MSHFQANAQPYIELKSRGQVQQFNLTQDEHRLGRDRQWADFALPDEGWDVLSSRHAVFRRNGTHYWIYDGDGTGKSSTNGTFAGHRRITPQSGYLLDRTVQNEEPRRKRTEYQTPNIFLTTLTPQGAGNVPLAIQNIPLWNIMSL